MNTPENDATENTPRPCYSRTSDKLITVQLIGTVVAIVLGFLGFQYQTGQIVAQVAAKIAGQEEQVKALKDDIQEIKDSVKELGLRQYSQH